MTELKLVLMNRRGISSDEADEIIDDIKRRIKNGESPEEVLWEYRVDSVFIVDLALE